MTAEAHPRTWPCHCPGAVVLESKETEGAGTTGAGSELWGQTVIAHVCASPAKWCEGNTRESQESEAFQICQFSFKILFIRERDQIVFPLINEFIA